MTIDEIESLPEIERAVTRASHDYYRALLNGAPKGEQQRLRRAWLDQIQHCWPEILTQA